MDDPSAELFLHCRAQTQRTGGHFWGRRFGEADPAAMEKLTAVRIVAGEQLGGHTATGGLGDGIDVGESLPVSVRTVKQAACVGREAAQRQ